MYGVRGRDSLGAEGAKGKEERGERKKKKREEEKGAPLVLGLVPPLYGVKDYAGQYASSPSLQERTEFSLGQTKGSWMTDSASNEVN